MPGTPTCRLFYFKHRRVFWLSTQIRLTICEVMLDVLVNQTLRKDVLAQGKTPIG